MLAVASPEQAASFPQTHPGRRPFAGFRHHPGQSSRPLCAPRRVGFCGRARRLPGSRSHRLSATGPVEGWARGWINKSWAHCGDVAGGHTPVPGQRRGRPHRRGVGLPGSALSRLKHSALLPSPSPAAAALRAGGSESGRSTPSLSVLSDSKPAPSTYQQAPRHFHIPGRHGTRGRLPGLSRAG